MKRLTSLHPFKWVSASQVGPRVSYTLAAPSKMITTFLPLINGPLLLDFSNSFSSIARREMFKEARSCILSLSTWLEFCYNRPTLLHFGDHTINSICGVQQGDPLGPLGFALTLHPIIKKLKVRFQAYWQTPGIWMVSG